jgi:hypothetical protein
MRTLAALIVACLMTFGSGAVAQDVKQHARGAVELGWRYFNQGDMETALKRFNQALILDPNFAPDAEVELLDEPSHEVSVVAPGASVSLGSLLAQRGTVVAEGDALHVTIELPVKAAVRKLLDWIGRSPQQ